MLNTIKNLVVIVLLLGVGYGAHVVLNRPITDEDSQAVNSESWTSPTVDLGQAQTLRPDVSLGSADSLGTPTVQPLTSVEASTAMDNPLPPIGSSPGDASLTANSRPTPIGATASAEALPTTYGSEPIDSADVAAAPPTEPTEVATMAEPSDSLGEVESAAASAQPLGEGGRDAADQPANQVSENDADEEELATLARSVQQQLDNSEFASALSALSQWYVSPSAREERKSQLVPLLDQLAGTVIYSRRHLLEPPYTVQDKETLEQIAERYQVPVALLAKINGIVAPYDLFPGETLKVVRGPFRAQASLSRHELTLFLDTNYAGRFTVRVGSDASLEEGMLEVVEKLEQRAYAGSGDGQPIPAESPENPYGRHWIGLRQLSGFPQSDSLGIHGTGEACTADDTRGCIGLQPSDAEDLYSILSVGSTVRIVR